MLMTTQGTPLVLVLVSLSTYWGVTSTTVTDFQKVCEKYAESVYVKETDPLTGNDIKYDTCLQNTESFITDSDETERYPHMVKIGYGNESSIHWASIGTLISERYVLTVAHTSRSTRMGPARWARLGEQRTGPERPFVRYEIVEKINHPNFKLSSVYNDIALYRLDRDVQFSPYIRPICLQTEHQFANTSAIATSWDIKHNGEITDYLWKFFMDIKQCNETLPSSTSMKFRLKDGVMDDFIMCASGDYCERRHFVPGSPLQLKLKNPYCMYSQVGIASFGNGCGGKEGPVVYTRISHFLPWIESIVWP